MEDGTPIAAVVCNPTSSGRAVGVALLHRRARAGRGDTAVSAASLFEFFDSERYTALESLLVSHAPGHVYLCDSLPNAELVKVCAVLESAEMPFEKASKSAFNDADVVAALTQLAGKPLDLDISSHKLALKAAAALVHKGNLTSAPDAAGSYLVRFMAHDRHVRLDAAVLRALNLFPTREGVGAAASAAAGSSTAAGGDGSATSATASGGSARSITSVHALLSFGCKTKGGKKLLRTWLLQPLTDASELEARANMVSAFVESSALRRAWREGLSLPDLDALSNRLHRKTASLLDVSRMYQLAIFVPELVTRLGCYDGPEAYASTLQATYVDRLQWASGEFANFVSMCHQVIEDITSAEPRINPAWDEDLRVVATERTEVMEAIQELHAEACAPGGWATNLDGDLKLERDKVRGYTFRTRRTSEKALRTVPHAQMTQVLKDGIYFTTTGARGLKALSDRFNELEREYESQSRALIAQAIDIARSYNPVLEATAAIISEIDAISSMAHIATSAPGQYVRPTLLPAGTGSIKVLGARHAVMEMQEGVTFIANDYVLDRDAGRFQIITGPNMGGKSTYIRTLGIISLLAQIGSYVPASEATLPIMDAICARIGAGDKAVKGVSTFMAEMLEASSIMSTATPRSLVIIDELGRGTSTYDGFGLAWSISEYLTNVTQCMTLFATHFHELTALQHRMHGVHNRHVTAHMSGQNITMLFAVRDGPCPSSFGIHVAELAAFPPSVIQIAREKAALLEATSGSASALMMSAGSKRAASSPARSQAELLAAARCIVSDASFAASSSDDKRRRLRELLDTAPHAAA